MLTGPRRLSSVSQLRSIVDRTYEAFNARNFGAYRELLDEDVELVMSGIAVRGLAAVTDFVAVTARARPGLRIEPQRVFVEAGDTLVTEVLMIDTDASSSTDQAATVEASACGLYRFTDGRIVEWRVYVDPSGEEMASAALMSAAAEQSALRRVAELVARHPVTPLGRRLLSEHGGEHQILADQMLDEPVHGPVHALSRRGPLVGLDRIDQLADRGERTNESVELDFVVCGHEATSHRWRHRASCPQVSKLQEARKRSSTRNVAPPSNSNGRP